MAELRVARSELVLGGPKSGKTARAESLAAAWLGQSREHRAVYIATAQAWGDDEMDERVAQHRRRRAERVPRMETVKEALELAHAIGRHGSAHTLVVADCLTLWLTARLMPSMPGDDSSGTTVPAEAIAHALHACAGPIVLVSNEFAPGEFPQGQDARAVLDSLGGLNREAAAACERVTLMSAGRALLLKGAP